MKTGESSEWIIREPFVKRPSSLLQQKLSNSSVTRKNQSSNNGNDSKNVDPFYDDDIDMFDVNQIDDNEEDDDGACDDIDVNCCEYRT